MTENKAYKYLLLLAGILFFLSGSAQDSIQALWEKANAFYTTEEYHKAIAEYEKISQSGHESARLYFNLGNAYYKAGDMNQAILNFERAQLLAPQDEDIEFNLRMVNQFVVTEINALPQPFFLRWRTRIINLYPADHWAGISIGSFILFLGLLGLFIFGRSAGLKRFAFWFGILAIIYS